MVKTSDVPFIGDDDKAFFICQFCKDPCFDYEDTHVCPREERLIHDDDNCGL